MQQYVQWLLDMLTSSRLLLEEWVTLFYRTNKNLLWGVVILHRWPQTCSSGQVTLSGYLWTADSASISAAALAEVNH